MDEIRTMKCNLCNRTSFKKVYKKNGYCLWKCKNCSLIFVSPQPSDKELSKAYSYQTGYFENNDFEEDYSNPFLEKILDKKKGKFLDIGCGNGSVVYLAKKHGWNAEGIDLNKDAVIKARKKGLEIKHCNIDNFRGNNNYYDLILMGDLIEHVKNPKKTILKARSLLKKGGQLIISTPNVNSFFPKYCFWVSKIFKITWSHPSPPYHLFEFSNENFSDFMERTGFKTKSFNYSNISLTYSIGNTGLFRKFKENYRKNKSFSKSLVKNNFLNSLLLILVFIIYLPGYIISKKLKVKDEMTLVFTK